MLESLQKIEFEIIMIVFGIGFIIYNFKKSEPQTIDVKVGYYAFGICCVMMGVIGILNKFNVW